MKRLKFILLAAALLWSAVCTAVEPDSMFADALVSTSLAPEISPKNDIYAGLLGEWDVQVIDIQKDGTRIEQAGEWIFARTLEGRGIQDVFIVPPRPRDPDAPRERNRYGTSVRMFDPATKNWRFIWINPVYGAFDTLVARAEKGAIVQEGTRANGQKMRWCFQKITPAGFHWTGEALQPDGSWLLEAEFFATRKK
jgi:hypothetical protein